MTENGTDEQLLKRAHLGDEAAFMLLYERHREPVFRFAYRMLGSMGAAEDVTHDCFLSLLKNSERFNPARGATLRTYLLAATRNLALKRFRQQSPESALDELLIEPRAAESVNPLRELLDAELAQEVQRALEALPPLQREALVLFEYEGLSLAEVAGIVEADVNTVKARLHRARQSLKKMLAPYWKGTGVVGARETLQEAVK